jgi:hypothetical protein
MKWWESLFYRTEQIVLVPGAMEMTIQRRFKTVLLFVAGAITDEIPYVELEKRYARKGYSFHIFVLPVPVEPKV